MNKKSLGIVLLIVGILILLLSLTADMLGIGGAPGFGYRQILGTIAGVVVAIIGLVFFSRK